MVSSCVRGTLRNVRMKIEYDRLPCGDGTQKWMIESDYLTFNISSNGVIALQIIPSNDAVCKAMQFPNAVLSGSNAPTDASSSDKSIQNIPNASSTVSASSTSGMLLSPTQLDLSDEFIQKNLVGNFRDYYHFRNEGEIDPRIKCLARRFPEKVVRALDVGCNTGEITCSLAQCFPQCKFVGVDIDSEIISSALSDQRNVKLKVRDVVANGIPSGKWDVVLFLSVARWLHLQGGDERLKAIFCSFGQQIPPGGLLVMEKQLWSSYFHCLESLKANGRDIPLKFRPEEFCNFLTAECGFIYDRSEGWQEFPEYGANQKIIFQRRSLEFYYKGTHCPREQRVMCYRGECLTQKCDQCGASKPPYICLGCNFRMCTICFEIPMHKKSGRSSRQESSDMTPLRKNLRYITLAAFNASLVPAGEDPSLYLLFDKDELVMLHEEDMYGWVRGTKIDESQAGWAPSTFLAVADPSLLHNVELVAAG